MKKISVFLFMVILIMAGAWQIRRLNQLPEPQNLIDAEQIFASPTLPEGGDAQPSLTIEAPESGQTAFELLKDVAPIAYKEYDFGVFIESIDGVAGDDEHYWAFYVNGEYAQAGVDQTVLQAGDVVQFKYESTNAADFASQ